MTAGPQLPLACDGCLGSGQCWICTGDGCHRCRATGRCHVCTADRTISLIPVQACGDDRVASAS